MRYTRLIMAFACLALALAIAQPAGASGPGTGGRRIQLDNEPAGPFRLRVVTSPTPPVVENLYVEVKVLDGVSGATITDAHVLTWAQPAEGETPKIEAQANHDIAPIPTEYAAHLPVPEAGMWRIHVQVIGTQGSGEVSFLQRVNNPTSLGWVIAIGVPLGGLGLLAAFFLWLQRSQGGSHVDRRPNF
jgi:hypothetical protein